MYSSIEVRRFLVDLLDSRHKAPDLIPTTIKNRKNVMYNRSFFYIQLNNFVYFNGLICPTKIIPRLSVSFSVKTHVIWLLSWHSPFSGVLPTIIKGGWWNLASIIPNINISLGLHDYKLCVKVLSREIKVHSGCEPWLIENQRGKPGRRMGKARWSRKTANKTD